ncbi:MAG TPA: stage IV sporulation protein A [Candidatus Faecousia intestinigallinarum]|nr:stage IV sporulation protein A [Candidatus Faecousia intestinigallinarum]
MEKIYADIAARTGGNIYIGVVGPVRTGKSTLIKRIMETLVIPGMEDPYRRERARDELPQSGSGKTIMTSEPKFVPEEAAEISPDGVTQLRVRMIDSVGYMVNGAVGAEEDGAPRMVTTPWFDHEIPMTEAAELGTKKVMEDHCSIGLVVTTDGSITDIPRADYLQAEARAIADMQATGKPFLVIVNTKNPASPEAQSVQAQIRQEFSITPVLADCQALDAEGVNHLLTELLYAFPMGELRVYLPRWMDALEPEHPVKAALYQALLQRAEEITSLGQAESALSHLREMEEVLDFSIRSIDLGTGAVSCVLGFPETLFYEILSTRAGMPIQNEAQLLSLLTELSAVKIEYDKIADALSAVRATGYGVVMPRAEEMRLEKPEILRKGNAFGVKLKAGAPSIHMIRVDIDTEISPMVGDEKQSQDLIAYLSGEEPEKLWQSNIFGKSVYELIQEGLTSKLVQTPEDVRAKFRGSLSRIVNEGAQGLICLIL